MPEPTLDLLTASPEALHGWASALFRWDAPKYFGSDRGPATLAVLRDAIVAAARSAPVGELTEADLAGILREWDRENPPAQIGAAHSDAAAIAALPLTASAVRITARRLARPSDAVLAEAKREGWDAARAFANEKWGITQRTEHWDAERDRRWPAPPKPARITLLSWGAMEQDAQGQWCVWDDPDRGRLLSVTASPWEHVRCFEDATAIRNRLAAQVAPERAK